MANELLRKAAKNNGVKLWQIAQRLNITDGNFSRKLRSELSESAKNNILAIINDIAKEAQNGSN